MSRTSTATQWLDDYGSSRYRWQQASQNGREVFHRPIGRVETAFDADGRYHEGRADLTIDLSVEVKAQISDVAVREKILLAWCVLRNEHVLLKARSIIWTGHSAAAGDYHFVIDIPGSAENAVEDAGRNAVFLEDRSQYVEPSKFSFHLQNTARVVDAAKCLARLFILPWVHLTDGRIDLQMMLVGGHMIMDGLTSMVWTRNLIDLLNMPTLALLQRLRTSILSLSIRRRLPLPQEALYPPILGSQARQRWWWLLTRILRHVRMPLRAGFSNPLARIERQKAISLPPIYETVLDYTKPPVLNAVPLSARTSHTGAMRLHRICRDSKVSIGAGCFALAALLMMEVYEQRCPEISLSQRKPFISGFPLNPRAFFNHHNEPDSLMLAFCDGIILPFLPSSLPLDGKLRLLARQAHRQLAAYQKRRRPMDEETAIGYMGSRGGARVLANQYLSSLERSAMFVPAHLRSTAFNPQGQYPARPNTTAQTCGVSSVGRRDIFLKRNVYSLHDTSKDFVADYREYKAAVRPREGEFLIGIGGDEAGLWVNVSIDSSSIDPFWVQKWKTRFETILDEPGAPVREGKARI
nr:hypothetical protein CFP56_22266 [Quercus suber]